MSAEAGDGEASIDGALPDASAGNSTPQSFAMSVYPPKMKSRACYTLAGYRPDPCLPPDDALLSWLGDLPKGQELHVTDGPFVAREREGRACCYSVSSR